MVAGYYIHEPSGELEAVARWENEGGRLGQNHDYILDSIGDEHLWYMDQAMPIERLGKRDEIPHAMLFFASDKAVFAV